MDLSSQLIVAIAGASRSKICRCSHRLTVLCSGSYCS